MEVNAMTEPLTALERQTRDEARQLAVLVEAGQACVDWARDMGECHLCGLFDGPGGRPHDEECPLRKLTCACSGLASGTTSFCHVHSCGVASAQSAK